MTIAVDLGRKATKQTNKQTSMPNIVPLLTENSDLGPNSFQRLSEDDQSKMIKYIRCTWPVPSLVIVHHQCIKKP